MTEEIKNSNWKLRKGRIIDSKQMTAAEKWFDIQLEDSALDYEPGQFVQVELFGVGEAPISICSSPTKRGSFELTVRAAGRLTKAMHALDKGAWLGIRGPFGKPFPVRLMTGNDLLFVAGGLGIAPLRSLINYVMANRREFGKVDILLGCKTPADMLFGDEIATWQKRMDINFSCTVDRSAPDWHGNVGLITSLIPGVSINPQKTFAVVVGPPVMYKFVIAELLKKGIPERQIILSLERHMKCGMGKCGHCQIDHPKNYYCCKDGPTFTYEEVKDAKKL
ncbi:MAG: oxidoreductase [Elusimicrobia bacterium GWF2_52_66]|nr:MAG: oxidoreductase [Elusimicrobia bacterium GWA2_51_34]OGR85607.1 MAG: oxidoreductase [Elusimicrobia bacterium GWF2_52_66]HAF96606.1 oxidoreductase [Elusimicrobiota bacterium]HCE98168.1 oxidoreductase [Elusimicrobiota bacterium]